MDKIVVKITHPHSHHPVIKTFHQSKISIGRGFDNDLILEDDYVSECHAELCILDQKLAITDKNSLNGVIDPRTKSRIYNQVIEPGHQVMIGRATLAFYTADYKVGLAKSFKKSHWFVQLMNQPLVIFASLLILLALAGAESATRAYEEQKWLYRLTAVCFTAGLVFVWAGLWAFITYLLKRKVYFILHLGTICVYYSIFYLLKAFFSILLFNLGEGLVFSVLEGIGYSTVCCLMIMRALRLATRMPLIRTVVLSLVLAVVIHGLIYPITKAYYTKHRKKSPHHTAQLYPKYFKVMPSHSLDQWVDRQK